MTFLFRGESRLLRAVRGLLTAATVLALILYAVHEVILTPIAEMGMSPNREFRGRVLPSQFKSSRPLSWNVILV